MAAGYVWHGTYADAIKSSWSLRQEVSGPGLPPQSYLGYAGRVSPRTTTGLFFLEHYNATSGVPILAIPQVFTREDSQRHDKIKTNVLSIH